MMRVLIACLVAIVGGLGASVPAQAYPDRPVRLIVPFSPGGVVDLVARAIGRRLEVQLKQPVVVENRAGAGSQVGTSLVANAPPDGYTLLVMDPSIVINPALEPNAPYKLSQLDPVATLTTTPLIVVVPPSLPVHNLRELVEYSKTTPGGISYASSGIGTTPHLGPELFKLQSGMNATHIPYRGGGPTIPDLISGRVQTAFATNAAVLPFVGNGQLRAIAQTGHRRIAATPNVPTAMESGYPDFAVELWTALFAPAGLPQDVRAKLEAEVQNAVRSEEFAAAVKAGGVDVFPRDTAATRDFVRSESDRWSALVKDAKITAQ